MNRAVAATNSADEIYGEGVYALTPLLKGWVLSHFLGHACVREISGEKMSTLCNTLWKNSSPKQSIKTLLGGSRYDNHHNYTLKPEQKYTLSTTTLWEGIL